MLGSRVFHTSRPVRFAMATIAAVVGGAVLAGSALAVGPPGGMPAGVPAGVPGGAGAGGPTPQVLATQICAQLQVQMGAQFTTKFGTQAGCLKQATALATAQAARCQTAADPQTCVTQGITAAATTLASGGTAGAGAAGAGTSSQGISAGTLADTTTTQTCTAAKAQLAAKFPFTTQAACKAKVRPTALKLATAAIAKCTVPSTMQACLTRAMQAGSAQLQAAVGTKKS